MPISSNKSECPTFFIVCLTMFSIYSKEAMLHGPCYKEGCVIPMDIWSEFRMGQYRADIGKTHTTMTRINSSTTINKIHGCKSKKKRMKTNLSFLDHDLNNDSLF